MHRVAWAFVLISVALCLGANLAKPPTSWIVFTVAFAVFAVGILVAHRNGQRLQRRWQVDAVRGELVLEGLRREFSSKGRTRYTIEGTLHAPDRPVAWRPFVASVPDIDVPLLVEGARVPVVVLDDEPDEVRMLLHPDRPDLYVRLQGR